MAKSTNPIRDTELLSGEHVPEIITETYLPIPQPQPAADKPIWQVRLVLLSDAFVELRYALNGDVIIGRGKGKNILDLTDYRAEELGVSRNHLALRVSATNLFALDLGSTNGSQWNGRSISRHTPYNLADGDILTVGNMQIQLFISKRPGLHTAPLPDKPTLGQALSQIAKAITSQLTLDEVLNQVVATAMSLTAAGETSIWLVDEKSGELFLEAQRGVDDDEMKRSRIPINEDNPAGKVIQTGKPLLANRRTGEAQPQLYTGYLVEALLHVPISLGGITFGVLTAAQRISGKELTTRDEQLLSAIADFAAIAIQNARLYQETDKALAQRVRELSALNEVTRAVSAALELEVVYDVLVEQIDRHWPAEVLRIYLVDERMRILRPFPDTIKGAEIPFGKGIIGKVVQTEALFVSNEFDSLAEYDPRFDHLNDQRPRSMACIPLISTQKIAGVMVLYNKLNGPFIHEDIAQLEAFAYPISTAIENARLYAESQQRQRAIQATALTISQPLLILDDNGHLLVSNEAATTLLEASMSQLFAAISGGLGRTTEVRIGKETYLSTAEHIPDVGTIVVMQNISYVKQLEKDRADFMHMLSHDMKNPLMAVNGWSSLLKRSVVLDEQGSRFLHEIDHAAERMLGMVNQLLQTVAQDDGIELLKEYCDLEALTARTLNDVKGSALNKSISLHTESTGQPYAIMADNTRLYHMLLNLVDNAIKYSPPETNVFIHTIYQPEQISIQVRDEGPGIPEKDLQRVFDKFFRGIQEGMQNGSGVGLAAVRNIVEAHGGRVWAENRKEKGSMFNILLPGTLRVTERQAETSD